MAGLLPGGCRRAEEEVMRALEGTRGQRAERKRPNEKPRGCESGKGGGTGGRGHHGVEVLRRTHT